MEEFKSIAQDNGICLAYTESVPLIADPKHLDTVIHNLRQFRSARVVACFCDGMTVRALLQAIKRTKTAGEFLLIGR